MSLGANLTAISPQSVDKSRETAEKLVLTFPVLSDPGNRCARKLGLVFSLREDLRGIYRRGGYDLGAINGDDSWELPMPATLVVGPHGEIHWAVVSPDYRERPEPSDVARFLEKMRRR